MAEEIKSLKKKSDAPGLYTMFMDATGGYSWFRVVGFIVIMTMITVWATSCAWSGTIIPIDETILYVLAFFVGGKPIQRIFESKEVASQLDYDFQMAQLEQKVDKHPDP